MKKIAILSDNFPPLKSGGIANAHYNLFLLLRNNDYNSCVFTYLEKEDDFKLIAKEKFIFRNGLSKFDKKKLKVSNIFKNKLKKWLHKDSSRELMFQYNLTCIAGITIKKKINKQLEKFKPDIVIVPDFGAPGYYLKKVKGAKYIYISHNNPMRLLNNPLIGVFSKKDAERALAKEQVSLSKMDRVICPSTYMRDFFLSTFSYPSEKVIVLPNVVDSKFIEEITPLDIHSQLNIDKNIQVVYIPGAGSSIKGSKYVVEIIRRINKALNNKVAFYLSGDLSEEQKYELNQSGKRFKIFSPGIVNYSENIGYVKSCNVCISPSLMESFGMALIEAMFCKLPCISFDVGGNRDVIINSETGYLIPYLDMELLVEKSVLLLNNQVLYNNQVNSIESYIQTKFSPELLLNKYITLFRELLNESRG